MNFLFIVAVISFICGLICGFLLCFLIRTSLIEDLMVIEEEEEKEIVRIDPTIERIEWGDWSSHPN